MVRSSRQGALPTDLAELIDEFNRMRERLDVLETPSAETKGSVLPKTVASVDELLARQSYSAEEAYSVSTPFGTPLPLTSPDLAAIPFTLLDRRRVRLQGSLFTALFAWNNGTSTTDDPHITLTVRLGLRRVDTGDVTYTSTPTETGTSYIPSEQTITRWSGRPFLEDYRVLSAGDWALTCSAVISRMDGYSGSVNLSLPKTSVQVLEKVA